MAYKRLPESDEERLMILRTILEQEEVSEEQEKVLSIVEFHELRYFINSFVATDTIYNQAVADKGNAITQNNELFKNAKLYISHFIQVLFLTVIRNEIKAENLTLYGLQENNYVLPDLSTVEDVLKWGEILMQGEAERIYRGGIPLYNPAIAKVKVHYEVFKESIYSLTIYEKNLLRMLNNMEDMRKKADDLIMDIWNKVEEHYCLFLPDEQTLKFKAYNIHSVYKKGEQLNVFDM